MSQKCPKCNKPVPPLSEEKGQAKYFPFCSERCKLIDLGAWIEGQYRIPDEHPDTEDDQQNLSGNQ